MDYCSLGRTGVQVIRLCLGCIDFGSKTADDGSCQIIDCSIGQGLNLGDTANIYTKNGKGVRCTCPLSMAPVNGSLSRHSSTTESVIGLCWHGSPWMDRSAPNSWGNHRKHIMDQCDASLRRLHVDYIDLYPIHSPMRNVLIDEVLRSLDDLIRAGKVRYIGTSNFMAWQVLESLWASNAREILPLAKTYGLGITPWSPLAGGFLTGKDERSKVGSAEFRFGGNNS